MDTSLRTEHLIAFHDCDIVTYSREMLARLGYPVANPNIDVVFCKGFYSRITDRMHGRVTRLLMTPLLIAIQKLVGLNPFLLFLDNFRYPLKGKFCMITGVATSIRIPWTGGLRQGPCRGLQKLFPTANISGGYCSNYEHKHQPLSVEDAQKGLMRMCVDISKSISRILTAEGIVLSDSFFRSLRVAYIRLAEDIMVKYEADAAINGLIFDRHEEAKAMEAFTVAINREAETFMENPMGIPLIPNWNRITSAVPGTFVMLKKAVDEYNRR